MTGVEEPSGVNNRLLEDQHLAELNSNLLQCTCPLPLYILGFLPHLSHPVKVLQFLPMGWWFEPGALEEGDIQNIKWWMVLSTHLKAQFYNRLLQLILITCLNAGNMTFNQAWVIPTTLQQLKTSLYTCLSHNNLPDNNKSGFQKRTFLREYRLLLKTSNWEEQIPNCLSSLDLSSTRLFTRSSCLPFPGMTKITLQWFHVNASQADLSSFPGEVSKSN